MNAQDRKQLCKLIDSLEDISMAIQAMRDNEEEKYYNLPDSLQESERGVEMSDAIEELDSATSTLDDLIDSLKILAY